MWTRWSRIRLEGMSASRVKGPQKENDEIQLS